MTAPAINHEFAADVGERPVKATSLLDMPGSEVLYPIKELRAWLQPCEVTATMCEALLDHRGTYCAKCNRTLPILPEPTLLIQELFAARVRHADDAAHLTEIEAQLIEQETENHHLRDRLDELADAIHTITNAAAKAMPSLMGR